MIEELKLILELGTLITGIGALLFAATVWFFGRPKSAAEIANPIIVPSKPLASTLMATEQSNAEFVALIAAKREGA